jgi:hypothetical protein
VEIGDGCLFSACLRFGSVRTLSLSWLFVSSSVLYGPAPARSAREEAIPFCRQMYTRSRRSSQCLSVLNIHPYLIGVIISSCSSFRFRCFFQPRPNVFCRFFSCSRRRSRSMSLNPAGGRDGGKQFKSNQSWDESEVG